MKPNNTSILATSVLALSSAIIGGFVSYYFASKSKKFESVLKFGEEKYSILLILLQGFVGKTANAETKKLVIDEKGQKSDHNAGQKAIGDIVLAMRKDLLGKTTLSYTDFRYTNVIK